MSGENIDTKPPTEFVQPLIKPRLSEKATNQPQVVANRTNFTKLEDVRSSLTAHDLVEAFSSTHQISGKKLIIEQTFILRLKSSWSNSKISGLSRIIFLDNSGIPISISSDWIACKNCGLSAPKNVHKLLVSQDGTSLDDDWGCVLSPEGSEVIFDLRKTKTVNSIRIINLREKSQGQNYGGIREISLSLNGKMIYSGELKRPEDNQRTQVLSTDIQIKQETIEFKESQNYLSKLRANEVYAQRIYSKTHNFSATQNLPVREGPFDPKPLSPTSNYTMKDAVQTANNFNIMPTYNLSDDDSHRPEDRGSASSKPDEKGESQKDSIKGRGPIEEQWEKDGPHRATGRTLTHPERSVSKASKDSQDSRLRKHPQIANSSAKYIFANDLGTKPRPSAGKDSHSRPKVNPVTPGRVFTLDEKVGTNKRDYPMSRELSQESHRGTKLHKKMLSTQSSKELISTQHNVKLKQDFKDLVSQNMNFEIPNLPLGKQIQLSLFTNWGDSDQIGLHGIELYDVSGSQIEFLYPEKNITRSDIKPNELNDEPMTLKKLISDSLILANVDLYWLTKLTGSSIQLRIKLPSQTRISLIRIWNIGNSKSQVNCGIRHIAIHLDERLIFLGEVGRCSGNRSAYFEEAEYIIFTNNKTILHNIEHLDWITSQEVKLGLLEKGKSIENLSSSPYSEEFSPKLGREKAPEALGFTPYESRHSSPSSKASLPKKNGTKEFGLFLELTMKTQVRHEGSQNNLLRIQAADQSDSPYQLVESLDLQVVRNWSNSECFGLRAIELFGKKLLIRQQRSKDQGWERGC